MSKFNTKIETVLDGIIHKADKVGVELIVESVFGSDEDKAGCENAAFVQNIGSGRFGVVGTHVQGYKPGTLQIFTFHPKMYEYAKAEGFNKSQCFKAFSHKILREASLDEFVKFILSDKPY